MPSTSWNWQGRLERVTEEEVGDEAEAPAGCSARCRDFSDVTVRSSSQVHFGNKIYAAPVTVINAEGQQSQQLQQPPSKTSRKLQFNEKSRRVARAARNALLAALILFAAAAFMIALATYLAVRPEAEENVTRLIINATWFHPREEWGARDAKDTQLLTTPVDYVVFVETPKGYYCYNFTECSEVLQYMQDYDMTQKNMDDIRYNFLVSGNAEGEVYEGRGAHVVGEHTPGYNSRSLGIGFMGDFTSGDTELIDQQIQHVQILLESAVQQGYLSEDYHWFNQSSVDEKYGNNEKNLLKLLILSLAGLRDKNSKENVLR